MASTTSRASTIAPNDLLQLLRARPFVPFRVVLGDGRAYDVRHPEMLMVALTTAVIGYPTRENPDQAERYDIVSIRHINRLEPMPQAAGSGTEGA